jgi:hypothetical protein
MAAVRITDPVSVERGEQLCNLWPHGRTGCVIGKDPRDVHLRT